MKNNINIITGFIFMKNNLIVRITISGLLIAMGIAIPMFSPLKIILEPASFTVASHVPIFIAMFISPGMAAAVAAGTTLGFLFGGFPLVVVFRASSHIIFATAGAFYLQRFYKADNSINPIIPIIKLRIVSFCIGLVHAVCELITASIFYFNGSMENSFITSVLLLVGVGTLVHSMVDFELANAIKLALQSQIDLKTLKLKNKSV